MMPEVSASVASPISYLMKNGSHDITGAIMGRPHPPVLGVIIGVTPGETDSDLEYAKAVRAHSLGVQTLTDVTTNGDTRLRERILASLDIVFGTVPKIMQISNLPLESLRHLPCFWKRIACF